MKILLIGLGFLIAIGGFAAFYYLSALGCAMNTTGCRNLRLRFFSEEALYLFFIPLVLGLSLSAYGYFRR